MKSPDIPGWLTSSGNRVSVGSDIKVCPATGSCTTPTMVLATGRLSVTGVPRFGKQGYFDLKVAGSPGAYGSGVWYEDWQVYTYCADLQTGEISQPLQSSSTFFPPNFPYYPQGFTSATISVSCHSTQEFDHLIVCSTLNGVHDCPAKYNRLSMDRVSVSNAGAQASGPSREQSVSSDGRFVAFQTTAEDVDGQNAPGVFLRDTELSTTVRVAGAGSGWPSVSDTGTVVTYATGVDADHPYGTAVHQRNIATGDITILSGGDPNCSDGSEALLSAPAASGNGKAVTWVSTSGDTDCAATSTYGQGFVWTAGTSGTTQLPAGVGRAAFSDDGSTIAYVRKDTAGYPQVYAWSTSTGTEIGQMSLGKDNAPLNVDDRQTPSLSRNGNDIAFGIGMASNGDSQTESGTAASLAVAERDRAKSFTYAVPYNFDGAASGQGVADSGALDPSVSWDGQHVAYVYRNPRFASDGRTQLSVVVANMATGTTARVDVSAELAIPALPEGLAVKLSGDGDWLAYSSDSDNLVPGDTNGDAAHGDIGGYDVFLRDRNTLPPTIPAGESRPGDAFCPVCEAHATHLDPINTATGAYETSGQDIKLPSPGVPFALTRQYSSDVTTVGEFGVGWAANLTASLAVQADGDVTVTGGTGATVVFHANGDGTYTAPPEVHVTLVKNDDGSWTVTTNTSQLSSHYDSSGQLTAQTDNIGQGLHYTYTAGKLSQVVDAAGDHVTVTRGTTGPSQNLITDVAETGGPTAHYDYEYGTDGTTPVLTQTTTQRGTTHYSYDTHNMLTTVVDPNGHTVVDVHYTNGVVSSMVEAGSTHTETFSRDPDTGTTTTTDASGGTSVDTYLGNELTSSADPLGRTTQYRYDAAGNRTAVIDALGNTTTYTYDDQGNVLTSTDPLGNTTTNTYNNDNRVLSSTDPLGRTTTYTYDAHGSKLSETDSLGQVSRWTYTSDDLLASETTPRGAVTSYTYDSSGNQLTVTNPMGHTTSYTYDGQGHPLTTTDPLGYVTHDQYDPAGRLAQETDPLGRKTSYTYDAVGNKLSKTTAAGTSQAATTSYTYDAANRLLTTTDPLGHVISNVYDAAGNLLSSTDGAGHKTSHTYDLDNEQLTTTSPNGNEAGADKAQYTTTYTYDDAGRHLGTSVPLPGGGDVTTVTSYDPAGRKVSATDADGRVTSYAYDADGDQTSVTHPAGDTETTSYDATGNKISSTDALGHTTHYTYDADGNTLTSTDPNGAKTSDTYDLNNNKTSEVSPDGNDAGADAAHYTTTYVYDDDGNQVSSTDPLGHTTTSSYDAAGEKTQETDPAGATTGYHYDDVGRLTSTTAVDGTVTITEFDLAGNKISSTDPAGNTTTYTYDDANRLLSTTDPAGGVTSSTYDANANVLTTTSADGGVTRNTYDNLNRLVRTVSPVGAVSATTYDPARQKTSSTDADGNTTRYRYDSDGRLTDTIAPDGTTTTNGYDAAGQQTSYTTPYAAAPGTTPSKTVDPPGPLPTPPSQSSAGDGGDGSGSGVADALTNPYPQAVLADNPVAYYRLGDNAGAATARDDSGHGADADATGVTFAQGGALTNEAATAARFTTARAEAATVTGLPTGNSDRSIETWVKTSSTEQQVITWWGTDAPDEKMELGINNGNQVYLTGEYNEASFALGFNLADGHWHHLVVSYTGSTRAASLFIDGQPEGTQTLPGDLDTTLNSTGLTVGGPEYHGYYLQGDLQDYAVYATALSAGQVRAHYEASGRHAPGTPGPVTNLATSVGDNAVAVSWQAPSSGGPFSRYVVTAVGDGAPGTSISVNASTTNAVVSGLAGNTRYAVHVIAYNGSGPGQQATADATTPTGLRDTYDQQVLTDQPAVFYRLAEPSGRLNFADSSGNGRDAAVTGSASGGAAGALATDHASATSFSSAEGQYAAGTGLPTGDASRSIEAWFKTADNGHQVITWWGTDAPNEQMELGINNGNQIYLTGEYNGVSFDASRSFDDNTWHHVLLSYDNSQHSVIGYLDGQSLGHQTLPAGAWNTTLDSTGLTVGGPQYHGYYFQGALADVAIYSTALPPARALTHYQSARLAALAIRTYAYDDAGRKTGETDPDGHTTTYGYDAAGNQTSTTDPNGDTTSLVFDADGRQTATHYSDGTTPSVTYAYDAAGQRTEMVDGTGTTSYTYNPRRQLVTVAHSADTVGYGYDSAGRVATITYPDGRQASRTYNANGQLATVSDSGGHMTGFDYNGDAALITTTSPNGVTSSTTVDAADRTSGINIHTSGGDLATFGYTLDPMGQITASSDSLNTDHIYSYNQNGQLTGQDTAPAAYGYDPAGNVTGLNAGAAQEFDPAGQLQTAITAAATSTTFGYDAAGDRTSATGGAGGLTTSYTYNAAHELTKVHAGASALSNAYNGDGLRTAATGGPDAARAFTWDSLTGSLPLLLTDGTNDYLYGPGDLPVEQMNSTTGAVTYLAHDNIGSTRLLTNTSGAVVGTANYDPYGTLSAQTGTTSTLGYTGEYTDPNGLVYLRARFYDPATAQFLTLDPLVDTTHAPASYADGNPLSNTDPSGQYNPHDGGPGGPPVIDPDVMSRLQLWVAQHSYTGSNPSNPAEPWSTQGQQHAGNNPDGWSPLQDLYANGSIAAVPCFGAPGCLEAFRYINNHPHDLAGAKIIAALYCVQYLPKCLNRTRSTMQAEEVISNICYALLAPEALLEEGAAGAEGTTASDEEMASAKEDPYRKEEMQGGVLADPIVDYRIAKNSFTEALNDVNNNWDTLKGDLASIFRELPVVGRPAVLAGVRV